MQKKKRDSVETQSAPFPNRPILLVHLRVSIRKRFLPLPSGLELRTLFSKGRILSPYSTFVLRASTRNASSSSVLSHSPPPSSSSRIHAPPIPPYFFFLLSANARRRNDFSGLCVSMTIVQNSAQD